MNTKTNDFEQEYKESVIEHMQLEYEDYVNKDQFTIEQLTKRTQNRKKNFSDKENYLLNKYSLTQSYINENDLYEKFRDIKYLKQKNN